MSEWSDEVKKEAGRVGAATGRDVMILVLLVAVFGWRSILAVLVWLAVGMVAAIVFSTTMRLPGNRR